jgi:hypothetical protein
VLYVARRYLKMSYQEWRDTPWWVQRAYIEGLEKEELLTFSDDTGDGWEDDPVGADPRQYAAMGLRVIDGSV